METTAVRACLFRIGGRPFAADVQRVREIVVLEDATAVPLGPAHLVGVTNLRGHVLAVLDARALLGLPPDRVGRGTPVLVVAGVDGLPVGIAIDGALGLDVLDGVEPAGDERLGPVAAGVAEWSGERVTLLDVAALLTALGVAGEAGGGD